jgi:hypothetical protein
VANKQRRLLTKKPRRYDSSTTRVLAYRAAAAASGESARVMALGVGSAA